MKTALQIMGIDTWTLRDAASKPAKTDWVHLKACVMSCVACPLHAGRTQPVFGSGNPQAQLLIVGEAPGFHEDQQGLPFVGRSGELLTQMLKAIGLTRDMVCIANIIKCRPPENRDPLPAEIAQCRGFLDQQIALIQPTLILALGRIAAQTLLQCTTTLSGLRGVQHTYQNIPVIVSYHPAYLLRTPGEKKKAFRDLQLIQQQTSRQTPACVER